MAVLPRLKAIVQSADTPLELYPSLAPFGDDIPVDAFDELFTCAAPASDTAAPAVGESPPFGLSAEVPAASE